MARKVRSDIKVGNLERKLGLKEGAIRNPDGTNARSDKKLKTLQREFSKTGKSLVTEKKSRTAKPETSADQKKAAKRTVKSNPKASPALAKKVSRAIKKATKK